MKSVSTAICLSRDPAAAGTLSAVPSGEANVWEISASDKAAPSPCLGGVSTDQTSSVRLAVSIMVGVVRTEFLTSHVQTPSEEVGDERTASTGSAPSAWWTRTAGLVRWGLTRDCLLSNLPILSTAQTTHAGSTQRQTEHLRQRSGPGIDRWTVELNTTLLLFCCHLYTVSE